MTWRRCGSIVFVGLLMSMALPGAANADFGLVPGTSSVTARNADGTVDTLAGSHPDSFTVHFQLNLEPDGNTQGGRLRNIRFSFPPGFFANPEVMPQCPQQDVEDESCLPDTQIGVLHVTIKGLGEISGPIYNLVPPAGVAGEIGYDNQGFISRWFGSVLTEEGYGLGLDVLNDPVEASAVTAIVWGVPSASEHDAERGVESFNGGPPAHSDSPPLAYLTLPASCGSRAPKTTIEMDSVQDPERYVTETVEMRDSGGNPAPMTGCDAVPFSPTVSAKTTSSLASNATGLGFELSLPNQNLLSPRAGAITETEPRSTKIVLPEGLTVNPSVAVGIGVCTQAEYQAEQAETSTGQGCPEDSKIGDIVAHTPLIEEAIEGGLYLATPYENTFKTLLAMYVVARANERGVLIKQAGKIELNPNTGQLTTSFDGLPPIPYSSFAVRLREGARAPLVTPSACGTYHTQTTLLPFSAEGETEARVLDSTLQVERGVDGGACPPGGLPPFAPTLTAGTINNAAGHYSPVYLRIERKDGEQEITGFSTLLPPGLSGNLSGVPFCSEQDIQRAREQTGQEAESSPACPAASRIGHSIAEAGVGGVLAQTPGEMFLAGPFEGAPFSVVSITAAKVGPFDLGTVVVHLPLDIDPTTAQVRIPSGPADQIPHILKGVVIHLRSISVWIDRQDFTINPTSCDATNVADTIDGAGLNVASPADDTTAASNSRFQAADCASLAFKPSFAASTSAKTNRTKGASLHVKLTYPTGALGKDTNIKSVKVDLPKQLPSRLTTLQKACTAATFQANPASCPAASRVGSAKATTPLIPAPLEGPAYFVSYGGAKFPELVIVLQGYGVTIDLHGETFIDEHTSVTSSTFHAVPDQPVQSFELTLPQGPNSALAAIGNLCQPTKTETVKKKVTVKTHGRTRKVTRKINEEVPGSLAMPTLFTAQNGVVVKQSTPITVTGCPKRKAANTKHKKGKSSRGLPHKK